MKAPPDETESPYNFQPHSQRELHSVQLLLALARTETERKQILHAAGMTVEDFCGFPGTDTAVADPEHK
ncbi:hypothetical protein [[Kitasatospora] papulosa]|uniref:hypothetical protein n=1 Tax=[Kitasatospora] papulosa TaxID=1464011 RepID=UPI00369390AA